MKRPETFIKKQVDLRYDLIVGIKEILTAIRNLTKSSSVNIYDHYSFLCGPIRTVVFDSYDDECTMSWGWVKEISRSGEDVWITSRGPACSKTQNAYECSTDTLVCIYEELDSIYKYEKNK